ncbi:PREDICTED: uncharacterized protein LOC104728309 [Camelina sativa]|uniref:Uncharacterized protein LOC104728309 n=1 Tax=Camelina sativa TaxID=90675 RepID=A0ABM0USL6_CAMSA|nr:PREDICTED: uncharacterized protein LOC104728309 [Camelina sativa]
MKLVADYDLEIAYHHGRAYLVADALSQKRAASVQEHDMESLVSEITALRLYAISQEPLGLEAADRADLLSMVRLDQESDVGLDESLRQKILREAHSSKFSIHPGTTKVYQDLKWYYHWVEMKKNVAD